MQSVPALRRRSRGRIEADKAMERLRRVIASGWSQAALIRIDTDLDPLRSRPDFQALLMDLGWAVDPFARPD
ncbi:MAG: TPR end-of-group domain-containing protein [Isosphaeraceae bacterium]